MDDLTDRISYPDIMQEQYEKLRERNERGLEENKEYRDQMNARYTENLIATEEYNNRMAELGFTNIPDWSAYVDYEHTAGTYMGQLTQQWDQSMRQQGYAGFGSNMFNLQAQSDAIIAQYSDTSQQIIEYYNGSVETGSIPQENYMDLQNADRFAEQASDALIDVFSLEIISNWEYLQPEERTKVLDIYAQYLGNATGIEIRGIRIEDLDNAWGENRGDGYLYIDTKCITNPELLEEALDTVIHEARHEYQRTVIANPEQFDIPQETINMWASNFPPSYISYKDDPFGYTYQPIELDARTAAESTMNAYYQHMWQQTRGA